MSGCTPGFTHLEHTADVLIEARGRSLSEALEQAALGVYAVMTDVSLIEPRVEERITVEGFDLFNLLYRWIEELLIRTDSSRLVFSKFKIWRILVSSDNIILEASVWGEEFDPSRHPSWTLVKAMTYAQMSMIEEEGCWRVRFVVDI